MFSQDTLSTGDDGFSLKAFDETLSKSGLIVFESDFGTDPVSITSSTDRGGCFLSSCSG